jgi:tetratricopeptide (TPR) repeat protein
VAEALAQRRVKVQGADHWEAVDARFEVEAIRRVLRQSSGMRKDYAVAFALQRRAEALVQQGRYQAAQQALERVLAIRRQALGEDHPLTAASYNYVASNLHGQGRYAAARSLFETALAIYRKALGEDHPDTGRGYNDLAVNLSAQGQYAPARALYEKALAIRRKALGEDHPDTANGYNNLAANLSAQGQYAAARPLYEKALTIKRRVLGEEHTDTATSYNNLAVNLNAQGQYAAAQPLYAKALAIRRKALGEDHPDTAGAYNNVAYNLKAQGQYAAAEPLYEKALAIRRKVLGDDHPDTASGYNNLAVNLSARGQYAAAQPLYEKALAIRHKALGEDHPATATGYNNLAYNLHAQGKCAAAQPLYEKALAIRRKALGEDHPDTARSYNNLAYNLHAQGKYAAAKPLLETALAIDRQALGEDHPDTAANYNNLAYNLHAQGKYAAAQPLFETALAIARHALGEDHPDTATNYNNLADNLHAQGKYAAAQVMYEKALAIRRKALGEVHPDTAQSYNSVADNLNAQGKYAAALPLHETALAIDLKVLGEDHADTARSYNSLGYSLNALGRYLEAEASWTRGAGAFARARLLLAATGLERAAVTGGVSPLPNLAAVLARNGKPVQAWQRYEESLARGTWDDLSARLRRSPAKRDRQTALVQELRRLDQLIERRFSTTETPDLKARREALLAQRRQRGDELAALTGQLEKEHGPAAGQVYDRRTIQSALAPDAALIGWIDIAGQPKAADPNGEHWAVLLRARGQATWPRLPGSGPKGAWTDEDNGLPAKLRQALQNPSRDWPALALRLGAQRLRPLAGHLAPHDGLPAVRHLIALPAPALAGVPLEVCADGYTVSYAPSGTLFAYLRGLARPASRGLLAVADPVFDHPGPLGSPPPLPPGGLLLTVVLPGSNAAHARLHADDVLLRYAGTELKTTADLGWLLQEHAQDREVLVTVWRDGRTLERTLAGGKLGAVVAPKLAPDALAARRQGDQLLAESRAGAEDHWPELPGTRMEADRLGVMCRQAGLPFRLLSDSDASEQELDRLAHSKDLSSYRYLHLATHGALDDRLPLQSAVILSRDRLPDPLKQLEAGRPVYTGRLTAEEVLERWDLHADLVTLSACQTALGKYEGGEGFVGFTQALLLSGARSVCLSLWKVDDTATALLMQRFYANLLGQRPGLKAPLGKAEALAEAKGWLRELGAEETAQQAATLTRGVARGKGRKPLPLLPAVKAPGAGRAARPYAHPYYWAAFVLVGDGN